MRIQPYVRGSARHTVCGVLSAVALGVSSPALSQQPQAAPIRQTLLLPAPSQWSKRLEPLKTLNIAKLAAKGQASRCQYTPSTAQWSCLEVAIAQLRIAQAEFDAQGELVSARGVRLDSTLTIEQWRRAAARGLRLIKSNDQVAAQELKVGAMRLEDGEPTQLTTLRWYDGQARLLATARGARWRAPSWEIEQLEQQLGLSWDTLQSQPHTSSTPGVLPPTLSVAPAQKIWEVRAQSVAGLWQDRVAVLGARAAFGQHIVGTLGLVNDQGQGLELLTGYSSQDQGWTLGLLGQDRFGAPLYHVSAQWEDAGAKSIWRASQLERGAWLRPWARRRAGVALSSAAHELTLSVSADQAQVGSMESDGELIGLRFGTRQEQSDWADLQLSITHQSSQRQELSAHRSALFAREDITLGAPSRLWLSGHAHARFAYEILEAEQGWTTNTSAGAGGLITTGMNITGRPHPSLLHTIRPQLIALGVSAPLTRQDSLIAPPLAPQLRTPYKAAALRLEHELISSAGVLVSAPMMALWSDQGDGFADALQGSVAARVAALGERAHIEVGLSRVTRPERAWQLSVSAQAPAFLGLTPSYQWSGSRAQALGTMLWTSPSSPLWQRELERAIIPGDDPSVFVASGGAHLWGLSWAHHAHTAQLQLAHSTARAQQQWLGVMGAYTLWWPVSGWGVELSAAYESERGLLSRLGLKLAQW